MLRKQVMMGAMVAAAAMATANVARAQDTLDARTEFTFNQPVELPGTTLPPGTYIFRFIDSTSSRKVLQVQAKDASNKNYGMFLTITAQRPQPSDEAELRFLETPAGQPAAVKTWWYPGVTIGREFIYPRSQALKIAQATNQPVLTTREANVEEDRMAGADLAYVSPSGQDTPVTDEQLVEAAATTPPVGTVTEAAQTAGNQTTADQSARTQPVATAGAGQQADADRQESARTALPRTASPLAGIGLLGLLSLAGGLALRNRR